MSDLLPCPMCGSIDIGGAGGIVYCYLCGVNIKAATTDIAAKQWNTRATPQGYKLVPVEPTDAMLKAAFGGDDDLLIGHADIAENAKSIYKAMIDAATIE